MQHLIRAKIAFIQVQQMKMMKRQSEVEKLLVERMEKCTKTKAGKRQVVLLALVRKALETQKTFTSLTRERVFHNPQTESPWETDYQLRRTCWHYFLKKADVRYRNLYQSRHTYVSKSAILPICRTFTRPNPLFFINFQY